MLGCNVTEMTPGSTRPLLTADRHGSRQHLGGKRTPVHVRLQNWKHLRASQSPAN